MYPLFTFPNITKTSLTLELLGVFLGYSPTQKSYKCYHSSTKNSVSKDVTFIECTPFFGTSQDGHQGETMVYGDQSGGDVFPNLGSAPTCYSIDQQPTSIPSPQPPIYSSSSSGNEQAAQQLPSLVRFKGFCCAFKRRQPILKPQPASTSDPSPSMELIQPLISVQFNLRASPMLDTKLDANLVSKSGLHQKF